MPRTPSSALLAAALVVAAAALGARAALPRPVVPVSVFDDDYLPQFMDGYAAYVDEVNAGDVLPSGVSLQLRSERIAQSPSLALAYTVEHTNYCNETGGVRAAAIFGVTFSALAEKVALFASLAKVPVLSGIASSPDLSSPEYTTFSRLRSTVALSGTALSSAVHGVGWRRVGVLHKDDPAALQQVSAFKARALETGLDVVSSFSFPIFVDQLEGDAMVRARENMRARLQLLRDSDVRVIVVISSGGYRLVLDVAQELGMVRRGYTYVFDDNSMNIWGTDRFINEWDDRLARDGAFDGVLSLRTASGEPTAALGALGALHADRGFPAPGAFHAFVYDSVHLLARAVAAMMKAEDECAGGANAARADCVGLASQDEDGDRLTWFIRNTPYVGATGNVSLDANGDRFASYDLVSIDLREGQGGGEGELRAVGLVSEGTRVALFDGLSGARWPGGATEVPADSPVVVIEERGIADGVFYAVAALAGVTAVAALGTVAFAVRHRALPIVKMSSPRINNLASAGVVVAMAAVVAVGLGADSAAKCTAQYWLSSLGFTLAFAPLFAKTWRVNTIFNSRQLRVKAVKDSALFALVGALLAVDVLLLGVWFGYDPLESRRRQQPVENRDDGTVVRPFVYECSSEHQTQWLGAIMAEKGALVVAGAVLAYKVRNVNIPALNDSKWIGFAIYNLLLSFSFAVPVALVMREKPTAAFAVLGIATVFALAMLLALVHGPKIVAVATGTTEAWTAASVGSTGTGTAVQTKAAGSGQRSGRRTPALTEMASSAVSGAKSSGNGPQSPSKVGAGASQHLRVVPPSGAAASSSQPASPVGGGAAAADRELVALRRRLAELETLVASRNASGAGTDAAV